MTKKASTAATIDSYIASQGHPQQSLLRQLRGILSKALPEAEEIISYQMPAYSLSGRIVLYFAGWKEHCAIYPAGPVPIELRDQFAPYGAGRGTLRFPFDKPIPAKLITALAKHRARAVAEMIRSRAASKLGSQAVEVPKKTRAKKAKANSSSR